MNTGNNMKLTLDALTKFIISALTPTSNNIGEVVLAELKRRRGKNPMELNN
jgi:hypothetical protein